MPKINVYLPDELATAVRDAGIPVSSVCQQALADAVAAADGVGAISSGELSGDLSEKMSRFTKRARTAVEYATKAAAETGREPKTVHLMGAIIGEGQNLAVSVLQALEIDSDDLIAELRGLVRSRAKGAPKAAPMKDALQRAAEEAIALGHNFVGCEHLLLGLAAGPKDELVAVTLRRMDADHETLKRAVVTAMAGYVYAREHLTYSGLSAPIRSVLDDIRKRLNQLETRG